MQFQVIDRLHGATFISYEVRVPEGSKSSTSRICCRQQAHRAQRFLDSGCRPHSDEGPGPEGAQPRRISVSGDLPAESQDHREIVAKEMTERFRRAWQEPAQTGQTNAEPHRSVTLASIVEKESALPTERPQVASVYLNRLRQDMALDCDPTTIYAALLEDRYRGKIYRSDLKSTNKYNTYSHPGLPPGPIANPGIGSLRAALAPAKTDYLYFVARPDHSGGHHFSTTIAEHNRAVQEYRKGQKAGG